MSDYGVARETASALAGAFRSLHSRRPELAMAFVLRYVAYSLREGPPPTADDLDLIADELEARNG